MQDFEKLGSFYLGRLFDSAERASGQDLLLYDSRDLVTHAVCVGMTGSGKTGLCLSLLEEAAIDGIPALVIDPKGDLANLLLNFPELRPGDFAPWINEDDARRKGVTPEEYARQQAELWRNGLAKWGQGPERLRRLRDAADFCIYTPGSDAGMPVSALRSFSPPPPEILEDRELLRERIGATATAVLSLLGVDADPVRSREHILICGILSEAWSRGAELDLPSLVQQIQQPPMTRVGVMELETFYPAKDRFELAMRMNNLLASPGFEAWLEGEPVDIGAMLHTPAGKPRVSIFSIAHLNDAERMFFVTLLLNQVVSWMRTQSGTTSLRALVYMDEIFGYFPPVANPPSKQPLLTLLKQARAFGVGVVLATQNPVDLDYKGLANAGTWFIGRLQTERDKARVLDGLEGAASSAGSRFDRRTMEQILSGLGNRVFLMNNVHEDAPVVFETRWALSYLRGPLTRPQLRQLMQARRRAAAASAAEGPAVSAALGDFSAPKPAAMAAAGAARPVLPPEISQFYLPLRSGAGEVVYQPVLFGSAQVRFSDAKSKVDVAHEVAFLTPIADDPVPVRWENAVETFLDGSDLDRQGQDGAVFSALPPAAAQARSYAGWSRDFANWLFSSQKIDVFRSPSLNEVSEPGEVEREFRIRLQQRAREQRDAAAEALRKKYAPRIATLEERLRRAQQSVEREAEQAKAAKMSTMMSIGTGLLGAFLGRKTLSSTTLGKASTAARSYGRQQKETEDVRRAEETVGALRQQLDDLNAEFRQECEQAAMKLDSMMEALETISIRPKKTGIQVRLVSFAWAPYRRDAAGRMIAGWE